MNENGFIKSNDETNNNEKVETINNQQKGFNRQYSNGSRYSKQHSNRGDRSDDFSTNTQEIVPKVDYSEYINEMYERFPDMQWPLHETWTFWYYKSNYTPNKDSTGDDWSRNGKEIGRVSTIEEFWSVFNYLQDPSKLDTDCDLLMFKTDIKPTWEDPRNKNQGRWYLLIGLSESKVVDQIWKNTVLALIGDQFCTGSNENGNEASSGENCKDDHICHGICGIRVQRRKTSNRIALWTTNCKDDKLTKAIGAKWKEYGEITYKLCYLLHESSDKESMYEIDGKPQYGSQFFDNKKKQLQMELKHISEKENN